ncbi:MAG: CDP-alcohol phosphatidyltransferase family protein [Rubricoccaceae bacterium]
MSKLPAEHRFVDLSDYGRAVAVGLVRMLEGTRVSSIQLTWAFLVAGVGSLAAILTGHPIAAAVLLMAKNVLDAADGEMARVRQRPSHTGRYLDSVFDFLINLGLVWVLWVVTEASLTLAVLAFLSMEFQGTIYNYYYLNQRRVAGGDTTSRVNEFARPAAYSYESAKAVAFLHRIYLLFYGPFDRLMLLLEGDEAIQRPLPKSFMTALSAMGLGAQLLVISVGLALSLTAYILPFLLVSLVFGLGVIGFRKIKLAERPEGDLEVR